MIYLDSFMSSKICDSLIFVTFSLESKRRDIIYSVIFIEKFDSFILNITIIMRKL